MSQPQTPPSLAARHWSLFALLVAVLPQLDRLPPWLIALVLLCAVWRLSWVEARFGLPGVAVRGLLLVAGLAGVFWSHHSFFGPEGGVSFLLVCAASKLLESRTPRDFFVSAVLDFFILATAFLFSQSLALTAYVVLATVIVLAALLALQQRAGAGVMLTLRRAARIALQALPLMLILFVFFPRLPPLWTLNLSQGSGRTGMSDSMSPGDISSLSESAEVAFRVEFAGPPPPSGQLYWRGLVMDYFDGKRWTQSLPVNDPVQARSLPRWVEVDTDRERPVNYRVILEPTSQPWLFALAMPTSSTPKTGLSRDFRLLSADPVLSRFSYDVQSWLGARADVAGPPSWMLKQALQLPAAGNPQSRQMARRWRLGSGSDAQYVRDVLGWYRAEHFFYTLEPPPLGDDRIDDFLFRTRKGFCEHYASSFVFLMRAAGIPARVVAGYQGGEKSPLANYWVVRQLDAHAWAEVWLPGQGWVEVDPTSAVAPDRIQHGAGQLAANRNYWGDSGMGAVRYSNYRLLKGLRNFADYVNYRWHKDVLGYNTDSQESLMKRLLGDADTLQRIAVMAVAMVVVAGLLFLWTLRGERRLLHRLDRVYLRYCERLARQGVQREAGEGPQAFARRVARQRPALAAEAEEFARVYMALRYRPAGRRDQALEKRLRRLARGKQLISL